MRKKKLPGWVIIPIIGVLVLVAFLISTVAGGKKETATALATAKATKEDIKEVYNISGTIGSNRTKTFYSPVNAPVEACNIKVGQAVNAGDLLVTFDTKDLEKNNKESQLNQLSTTYGNQATKEQAAKASAASAKSISSLKSQIKEKEAEVADLTASVTAAQSANTQKLRQLQNQLTQNKNTQATKTVEVTSAKTTLETLVQNCVGQGYPTEESAVDQALKDSTIASDEKALLTQLKQAYTNSKKVEKELASLQTEQKNIEAQISSIGGDDGGALATAQTELASLKSSLASAENSTTDSGITGGQAKGMEVSENLAELSTATVQELLEKGREGLKAEFSGIISDVQTGEGAMAAQGGVMYTLVSNEDVVVDVEVPSEDFDKLNLNGKAIIKLQNKEYEGTLVNINKIAIANEKGTPVIGAQIRIDHPDEGIYIGVTVKTLLTVDQKKDVLTIPSEAINTGTNGDFVYIIKNNKVQETPVEVGISSDSRTEIIKGISKGDQVVTDMSTTIKDGMKATAKEE